MDIDSLLLRVKEDLQRYNSEKEDLQKSLDEKDSLIVELKEINQKLENKLTLLLEELTKLRSEYAKLLLDNDNLSYELNSLKSNSREYNSNEYNYKELRNSNSFSNHSISNEISAIENRFNDKLKEYEKTLNDIKNYKEIISSYIDPRIKNEELPNDAKVTYEFGARSFISDVYKDFTWRNGFWYKISNELYFTNNMNNAYLQFKDLNGVNTHSFINDSFKSIIISDKRYFISHNNLYENEGIIKFKSPNKMEMMWCPSKKTYVYIYSENFKIES